MSSEQTNLADYGSETVDLVDIPTEHLDVGESLAVLDDALLDGTAAEDAAMDPEVFDRLGPEERLQAVALRLKLLEQTVQQNALSTTDRDDRAFW